MDEMNPMDEIGPTRFNKIKTRARMHWRYNKKSYVCLVTGVVIGAATAVLLRKPEALMKAVSNAGPAINFVGRDLVINENPIKRLSYIIKYGEHVWETQREAAEWFGVSEIYISQYLNGKRDHIGVDLLYPLVRLGIRGE